MNPENPMPGSSPSRSVRKVCFLSRSRGWVDPEDPHRPTSEVNLLAVAIGAPVWTLGTAWESVFHHLIPPSIEQAYRKAMVRTPLTESEVERLRDVAARLGVVLEVND